MLHNPAISTEPVSPLKLAGEKIGIEANLPIDRATGALNLQIRNPRVIADTGAGWVRLNFVLGPWSSPADETIHNGRTWTEAYQAIVSGLRGQSLSLYGLIGAEAMPSEPGDRFRLPPQDGAAQDDWLDAYVANFVAIVEMFHADFRAFELFNEPDDWHGQSRAWIHPGWFAIILQRVYAAVRERPHLDGVKVISGPLEGLEVSNNGAVTYLREVYRAGKRFYGWGQPGRPFPFDGVGYHIYVQQGYTSDPVTHERTVRAVFTTYLDQMHALIRMEEGRDKPLYVSEAGWNSDPDPKAVQARETFQANALRVGLDVLARDPFVELGVWFCTQDFYNGAEPRFFGLYRIGDVGSAGRKPAYDAFAAACRQPIETTPVQLPYTNQMVLNAFYYAAVELRLANRWSLLNRAGLSLAALAADRQGLYRGKPVQDLPNLSTVEKQAIARKLAEQLPRAMISPAGGALLASPEASDGSRAGNVDTKGPGRQRLRQPEQEDEVLEQEILGLVAEHRASLWIHRVMLAGALAGLLLATLCAALLGLAVLLLIL